MKHIQSSVVAICLALLANNLRAELTQTDADRLCKQLKVTNLKCFADARAQLKTQPAAEYLKNYLKDPTIQSQVSLGLEKILPQINTALRASPNELAFVSIAIDSSTNGHNLRSLQLEGLGDAALQAMAPGIISGSMFGSLNESLAKDSRLDTHRSHVICLGFDDGIVKATSISFVSLRSTLTAAVEDAQKSVALAPKGPPVAPTNFRIQIAP